MAELLDRDVIINVVGILVLILVPYALAKWYP